MVIVWIASKGINLDQIGFNLAIKDSREGNEGCERLLFWSASASMCTVMSWIDEKSRYQKVVFFYRRSKTRYY